MGGAGGPGVQLVRWEGRGEADVLTSQTRVYKGGERGGGGERTKEECEDARDDQFAISVLGFMLQETLSSFKAASRAASHIFHCSNHLIFHIFNGCWS